MGQKNRRDRRLRRDAAVLREGAHHPRPRAGLLPGDRGGPRSLGRYVHFRADMYTRNLVYRDDARGHGGLLAARAAHGHPHPQRPARLDGGASRAHLAVVNYKWLGCNAADNQNVAGWTAWPAPRSWTSSGARSRSAPRRPRQHRGQGADHPPGRGAGARSRSISLHLYSRPIDSCVAFDLEKKRCYRRLLQYYSRYGDVVVREGDLRPRACARP